MQLPTIAPDKALHVIYGGLVSLFVGWVAAAMLLANPAWFGLAAAAGASALKELADWLVNRRAVSAGRAPPHGVEFADFAFTCAGGALVLAARLTAVAA